jgi:hypothetical protein
VCDRCLSSADVLRVVPDHLVQHLLQVFRRARRSFRLAFASCVTRAKILWFTGVWVMDFELYVYGTASATTAKSREWSSIPRMKHRSGMSCSASGALPVGGRS